MQFDKLLAAPNEEQVSLIKEFKYKEYVEKYGIDIYGINTYNDSFDEIFALDNEITSSLKYLRYLEITSKNKNMHYYTHSECDSQVTWFEYLGNRKLIGIKSCLNSSLIEFALQIYYSIFSINSDSLLYYMYLFSDLDDMDIISDLVLKKKILEKKNDEMYGDINPTDNCYYLTIKDILDIYNYKLIHKLDGDWLHL